MNKAGYMDPTAELAVHKAARKIWTREEEQKVVCMLQDGFERQAIQNQLNITRRQLESKIRRLKESNKISLSDLQLAREWRKICLCWKEILMVPELQQRLMEYQADPIVQTELERYRREELKQRG